MKFAYFIICFILSAFGGYSQSFQQVAHCPSNEVYDMLLDKKGFIWIAHNLGVSRYDGINFTNFSNSEETSISMTDLVEDNYGRIWCHNFNGQIFYIKDDKMVYLKEYDFKKETVFPRMVLYKDELVVTTSVGMFVCNTKTLKCRYMQLVRHDNRPPVGTFHVCVIKDKILVQDAYYFWYTYKTNGVLTLLPTKNLNFNPSVPHYIKLEPHIFRDTAFLINNQEGDLYGICLLHLIVAGSILSLSRGRGRELFRSYKCVVLFNISHAHQAASSGNRSKDRAKDPGKHP